MSQNQTAPIAADADIKKLSEELEAVRKELDSLAYAVSHDLRAPLRAIEGFAEVVLDDYKDKLDSEGQRFLDIIRSSSIKASRMVEGILLYSRLGRHEMTMLEIDSNELVQTVIGDLDKLIGGRKIEFDIEPLPKVQGDFFLLREVWKCVIANAIKFSRNASLPRITVQSHESDGAHVFSICDNGVGFDMKYSDKLFQLFQRLHGETEFEGTGVGLALANRLIVRHGGKIWAEAKPHEGATFFFSLPK